MNWLQSLTDGFERRAATPAYSGWVIGGISLCFFGAATNTLVGWLYVISGVMFALLAIGAWLPPRTLQSLEISRHPISPISAGETLTIELEIANPTPREKVLVQIFDLLPRTMAPPATTAIAQIPARAAYIWQHQQLVERRGIYHWQEVELRTATPLGLFWSRRTRLVPAKAIVYPTVLPLSCCPLLDSLGEEDSTQQERNRRLLAATAGLTRGLRPYRRGDSTRLIHWRTSARYGELRVREMEIATSGREVIVALDSGLQWDLEAFEQAVIAAASIYFYARRRSDFAVAFWTAGTGMMQRDLAVLETLAGLESGEAVRHESLPQGPVIWLTANPESLNSLSRGSRWLLFPNGENAPLGMDLKGGVAIDLSRPLAPQLQSS